MPRSRYSPKRFVRLRSTRLWRSVASATNSREQVAEHEENRSTDESFHSECGHGRNAVFRIASARENLDDKDDGRERYENSADAHQRR
jgi:hypothetical protein